MKRGRLLIGTGLLTYLWGALFSLVWRVTGVHALDYEGRIGPDVEAQLAFIHDRLHAANSVALHQPNAVWVVFAHTLYGYTLVNTVLLDPSSESRRANANQELSWLLERLDRPEARSDFSDTQVPYGVLYLGHRNLILAGLMRIDPHPDPRYEREYHQNSRLLYGAFMASPSAHLETYPGHAWPADNAPALYSLLIHDQLYGTGYRTAAGRWIERLKATADSQTGVMASKIDYSTGAAVDVPRGCGTSFTLPSLPDIDSDFARTQYAAYRQHFFKTTLGFAGIREYPPDYRRGMDIDSGPIILDVGAAATGLGIAATNAMGDEQTLESILRLAEIIGWPMQRRGQKSYLLGQLLVGDEIQVWGKTVTSWTVVPTDDPPALDTVWPPLRSISPVWFYSLAGLAASILALWTARLARCVCRSTVGRGAVLNG